MIELYFIIVITILSLFYFLTLAFLERGLKNLKQPQTNSQLQGPVKVSIIVSSRNEEDNLPALIDCLSAQQTKNIELEFILFNDR